MNILHSDKRWNEVIKHAKDNFIRVEVNLDLNLVAFLDTIFQDDQKYRMQLKETERIYGLKSEQLKFLWKIILETDSINLIKIKKFIDNFGWLGPNIIGIQGNGTLWLVIQHSDIKTQEKYLPMLREAVKKGNASPSNLAYLEDRVTLRQGQRQIYGTQIGQDQETGEYYVQPLLDPDNVDKRREEIGFGKLQDYVSGWGINWNVEEYKKKLPEIEAKQKK